MLKAINLYSMEFEIPLVSLLFTIMLLIVYFSKKSINSLENRIFRVMLIATFVEIFLDFYVHMICSLNSFEVITSVPYYNLFNIINKFIVICFGIIFESLFVYILIITYGGKIIKNNFFKMCMVILNVFFLVALSFTKIVIVDAKTAANVVGGTPMLGYIIIAISLILSFVVTIKNYKSIDKRYLPIITIFIVLIICYLATIFLPGIILYDFAIILLCYLMYFTIENPDMKLLKEMHKAKEISDNANEEKTMFLYNMTQEIRNTTDKINDEADIILDSDSLEQDKDSARNIKGETAKFRSTVNDIMDVSAIDTSSIKIYNSKYNIKNLLKEIVSMYNGVCMNKGLEFRTNIEHDIPELLYGDSIGLKKSIMNILNTSIKNTLKGYIEFNVNTIKKNDICRLIITIEDSGIGIKSSELEKIKIDNKNISLAYKLITLMNGTMVISSDYGIGSKIKIVLDQRVVDNISREEKQYNEVYNNKKILIVDDSEAGIKIIEKLLKGSNIIIDKAFTGRECLDKIKSKNKYDVILLDEELSQIKGYELLIKLKEIRSFNIPVILLSKDNSYEYNEEYKRLGFSGILIKPIKKEILITSIDKFMRK